MKKFLAAGLAILSMNVFSQSYVILNNGVTLTLDKAGFVYDFNHFIAPYKVNFNGGTFFAEEDKVITVDELGFLYRKDIKVEKVKAKGTNYLIDEDGDLLTFDSKGFYYKFEKKKDDNLKKVANFGGIFFTANTDTKKKIVDLFTVNNLGNYFKMTVEGLNPADIAVFGGNYFVTNKSVVYTVSNLGFVFPKPEVKIGLVKKLGGNFFIDSANVLYTVSADGFLYVPSIPANLKVDTVSKIGANYLIDQEGKLFAIDNLGNVYERVIKDHDLKNSKVLSI